MSLELESLIQRIEDGTATDAELEIVRAELSKDAWPLADLRAAVLSAGTVDVSPAVMAVLGVEVLPVADAVYAEAGDIELADGVFAALSLDASTPVAEAVRHEAGDLDRASAILAALELDSGLPLAEALAAEAGEIDLSDSVMGALGLEELPLAEAVAQTAGDVDVADAVMARLGAVEAGPAPVPVPAMPSPVQSVPELPAPANRRPWVGVMLAAAMALVVVGAGSLVGGGLLVGSMIGTGTGATSGGGIEIANAGGSQRLVATEMVFASAAEVVVEDLSFGDDVMVFQDEGDDGALILWVDEEVL